MVSIYCSYRELISLLTPKLCVFINKFSLILLLLNTCPALRLDTINTLAFFLFSHNGTAGRVWDHDGYITEKCCCYV